MKDQFIEEITSGYTFKGKEISLGTAMLDGEAVPGTLVKAPLKNFQQTWINSWCYWNW